MSNHTSPLILGGAPSSTARMGTVYHPETGKLFRFDPRCIEVLVAWPRPKAWRCHRRQPGVWRGARPAVCLWHDPQAIITRCEAALAAESPMYVAAELRELRTAQWMQAIPPEVRAAIEPYPVRHWHLLSLVAACGTSALDLIHATPALAFALASNWVFHKPAVQRPLRSARTLLGPCRSQRDLLAWLGFPGTDSALRLLRKLPHPCIRIDKLLYLRSAMHTPDLMARLRHLPTLNTGALRVATDPRLSALVTPRVLLDLATWEDPDPFTSPAYQLSDCVRMLEQLHPPHHPLPKLHSLRAIHTLHEELVNDFHVQELPDQPFGPPPFRDDATFQAIRSTGELQEEGRLQSNCIGSYGQVGLSGLYAFYRVQAPERATLCLRRTLTTWQIQGLECAGNRKPSDATRRAVQAWLERNIGMVFGCPSEPEEGDPLHSGD